MSKKLKGFQKGNKINIGRKHTEITRKKMSKDRMGENNPFYGKKHSDKTKKKLKKFHIGRQTGKNNPFYGIRLYGEKNPNWKGGLPMCKSCGKILSAYHVKRCTQCWHEYNRGKNSYFYGKKHTDETKKRLRESHSGEKSYMWKGGISKEPYAFEFNKELKEKIRQRDSYTCQECNYTENQLGYRLRVHHIDYNKKNNNENNLISLCRSCHSKTNFKRDNWTNYFQNKLKIEQLKDPSKKAFWAEREDG